MLIRACSWCTGWRRYVPMGLVWEWRARVKTSHGLCLRCRPKVIQSALERRETR